MNKFSTLIAVFALIGCSGVSSRYTETNTTPKKLNENEIANLAATAKTNKSLSNAFAVLAQFEDVHPICRKKLVGWGDNEHEEIMCNPKALGICETIYLGDGDTGKTSQSVYDVSLGKQCGLEAYNCSDYQNATTQYIAKKFDILKKYFLTNLSAKDKAMMQKCHTYARSWYTTNEEGCAEWLASGIKTKCLFDYQAYLPNNIKISSYENFVALYIAYQESIFECDTKTTKTGEFVCDEQENCYEKENELTVEEKQHCYNEVEKKLKDLAQSGDL